MKVVVLALTGLLAAGLSTGSAGAAAAPLRLNQIQVIGTHNSYHYEAPPKEAGPISAVAGTLAQGLQYAHPPLDQQLGGQAVRQVELDVYADPGQGGRYATPLIRRLVGEPAEYDPRMRQPGTKVMHIADLDYHSNCPRFVDCLAEIRDWSHAHPSHVPITILIEFKDTLQIPIPNGPSITLVPWTSERMRGLDQEIRSVLAPGDLITPDDVRSPGLTLEQSVLRHGWPTLDASRGKIMFIMDNSGTYRDSYIQGNPSLEGRVLFTNSSPGQPDAAFMERNDPVGSLSDIKDLVSKGYMVRTRADVDTVEARADNTRARDAALASGAQWISTDYPVPGLAARFDSGYYAALPGFVPARCNPITAPATCSIAKP
ncbi:MAG TPA: phosphatidylinositol-specific phospholipase C1-like protein [Streptosporangiaceae bacterium]|nr:phosphatidylinositol-specific phospholipase C1-like protein [Streptosporangiaceae bacterium]